MIKGYGYQRRAEQDCFLGKMSAEIRAFIAANEAQLKTKD
jgi:hypothetical protein